MKQAFDSFKVSNKNYNDNTNDKNNSDTNVNNLSDKTGYTLKLPYKGDHGINLIKSMKTLIQKTLPEKPDVKNILTGTKLSSHFKFKIENLARARYY